MSGLPSVMIFRTIGSSDRAVSVFGEPRKESMIGINQFRFKLARPRVAQPDC
jgi:hypothetical protein